MMESNNKLNNMSTVFSTLLLVLSMIVFSSSTSLMLVSASASSSAAELDLQNHRQLLRKTFYQNPPMSYTVPDNNNNLADRSAEKLSSSGGTKMRITIDTSNLFNTSQYCTAVSEVQPTYYFSDITCTAPDVLTTDKRNIYVNDVIPMVVKLVEDVILLKQNEVIPSGQSLIIPQSACSDSSVVVPASHSTTGVANSDFVVYLTALPLPSFVNGFAFGCSTYAPTGRIVSAQINIPPHKLAWSTTAENLVTSSTGNPYPNLTSADRNLARLFLHEFLHTLSFNVDGLRARSLIAGEDDNNKIFRRGKRVHLYNGTNAVNAARKLFNCPTLDGVELEDEAPSALEHWEARTLYGDLLNPVANRNLVSSITLAAFQDLGHFVLADDYERYVEPITFGNNFGCSLFYNPCNTTEGGKDDYFCFDESMTDVCNFDYTAYKSYCQIDSSFASDLPSWAQYFPGEPRKGAPEFFKDDYCPRLQNVGAGVCMTHDRIATTDENELGNRYSMNSRCFYTRNFKQTSSAVSTSGVNTSCFESRCVLWKGLVDENNQNDDKKIYTVEFRVGGSGTLNEQWHSGCLFSNESDSSQHAKQISITGFDGHVLCPPNAAKFCFYNRVLGGQEVENLDYYVPPTTTTTTPVPDVNGPPIFGTPPSSASSYILFLPFFLCVVVMMLSFY